MTLSSRLIVTLLFFLTGCSGQTPVTSEIQAPVAPVISNLQYSPKAAYVNSGGTEVPFSASCVFADPDGDISSFTASTSSGGVLIDTQSGPISGAAGETSGSVEFLSAIDTRTAGSYEFELYLTDATGRRSNSLSGTVRVSEFPWKAKTTIPSGTIGAAALVGGTIFNLSGSIDIGTSVWQLSFHSFDPVANVWATKANLPGTGFQALAGVDGKLYGFGGMETYDPVGGTIVKAYDPVGDQWSLKSPMISQRRGYGVGVLDGKVYVVGGVSAGIEVANVDVYDVASDSWSAAAEMPTARKNLAIAVANGKLYALGGYLTTSSSGYLSAVEEYDPSTNRWTAKAPMPWPPREGMGIASVGTKVYVAGGENWDRVPMSSVYAYDPLLDTWSAKEPIPVGMSFPAAAAFSEKNYLISDAATYEYTPSNDISGMN